MLGVVYALGKMLKAVMTGKAQRIFNIRHRTSLVAATFFLGFLIILIAEGGVGHRGKDGSRTQPRRRPSRNSASHRRCARQRLLHPAAIPVSEGPCHRPHGRVGSARALDRA